MTTREYSELLDAIHHKLFWTTYKAYAIPIPEGPVTLTTLNLDLHVTSGDLSKWLVGDAADVPAESWSATRIIFLIILILGTPWLARQSCATDTSSALCLWSWLPSVSGI